MFSRLAILFPFVLVAACSSNNSSNSVTPKTIAGVCGKLDSLSCAQPNCVSTLTTAQTSCAKTSATGSADFQALIDCMATTSFACDGNPNIPRTKDCQENLAVVSICAGSTTATDGSATPADGGTVGTGSGSSGSCNSSNDCTNWPCACADGTEIEVASCTNGVCAGVLEACGPSSEGLVSACKTHGGVN